MAESYRERIARLVKDAPFGIDPELRIEGRPPTMASSEFLTNKQQGDWAEQVVFNAINNNSREYVAIQYGRSESLAAGDEGFDDFYRKYQEELNNIGKRPDLIIFKKSDTADQEIDIDGSITKTVSKLKEEAVAFIEKKDYASAHMIY